MSSDTGGRWYGFKNACERKIYYALDEGDKKKCTEMQVKIWFFGYLVRIHCYRKLATLMRK